MSENYPSSRLATNILSTLSLDSVLSDILTRDIDNTESQKQIELILNETNQLLTDLQGFTVWCNKAPIDIIKQAIKTVPQLTNTIYQWQRIGALTQKNGHAVTAKLFNQRINILAERSKLSAWSKVITELPEKYLFQQADKWWKEAFALDNPQEKDSYFLERIGKYKKEAIISNYRQDNGLSKELAESLYLIRQWQIGKLDFNRAYQAVRKGILPISYLTELLSKGNGYEATEINALLNSLEWEYGQLNFNQAYTMFRKGELSLQYLLDLLTKGQGLTKVIAQKFIESQEWSFGQVNLVQAKRMINKNLLPKSYFTNLATKGLGLTSIMSELVYADMDYDFSVGELANLSQLIPLSPTWVDEKLSATGLKANDKAVVKAGIEKRIIRDEIKLAWNLILDDYMWGLITETDLNALLTSWNFTTQEVAIRLQIANIKASKLVTKLMRDADIYLYRKSTIDEDTLLSRLLAFGLPKGLANAIVRNESAKTGNDWEIPEE